jgi:hypothetical protein
MKHGLIISSLVVLAGCFPNVSIDPEGYACLSYADCPNGFACVNRACHAAAAACRTAVCKSPPVQPTCLGNVLRIYEGRCDLSNGTCAYDLKDVACANGCENGGCKCPTDCLVPPTPVCISQTTLRSFMTPGVCNGTDGTCSYQAKDQLCPVACVNGLCG